MATITLTKDTQDDLVGTAGNDIFRGEITNYNNVSANNTLSEGDRIDGSDGVDRFVLTATDKIAGIGTTTEVSGFEVNNVEELEVRAYDADGWSMFAGEVVLGLINVDVDTDGAGADTGLNTVLSNKSTANITLNDVADVVALNLTGNGSNGTVFTTNYVNDVAEAPDQTQVVTLNNFGETKSRGTVQADGMENFDIRTVTSASVVNVNSDVLDTIKLDLAVGLDLGLGAVLDTLNTIEGTHAMVGSLKTDASASFHDLTITTGQGHDTIISGHGDDVVNAGDGNNNVSTNDGNDTVISGTGADVINAGNGDNNVFAASGNNNVTAGNGNDVITTTWGADIINAGDGHNTVEAGNGNNVVNTGSGNDAIKTGSGNDVINAGDGDNVIAGGDGDNNITVGNGSNSITVGTGVDTITVNGALGLNTISAGSSPAGTTDTIRVAFNNANAANSFARVTGVETVSFLGDSTGVFNANNSGVGTGANKAGVTTYAFDDTASPVARIVGSVALNNLINNATVKLNENTSGANLTVTHGANTSSDVLTVSTSKANPLSPLNTNLATLTIPQAETLNIIGTGITIGTVIGGQLSLINASTVTGDVVLSTDTAGVNQKVRIVTNTGNDNITTGEGNDTIIAGAGNDFIRSGSGIDSLEGGDGDDTFAFTSLPAPHFQDLTSADIIKGGNDTDTVQVSGNVDLADSLYYGWNSVEVLDVSDIDGVVSNDTVWLNTIAHYSSLNTVKTGDGNDDVTIGEGFNRAIRVELGGGDDSIVAVPTSEATLTVNAHASDINAADTLTGGNGTGDTLELIADDGTAVLDSMTRFETVKVLSGGFDEDITIVIGNDNVIASGESLVVDASDLTDGFSSLTLDGTAENDSFVVTGGTGADSIRTGNGDDVVDGGAGDDYLEGNEGDDQLDGGLGDDVIVGGLGADQLTGDLDSDTFVIGDGDSFLAANALQLILADVITDFTSDDYLNLGTLATDWPPLAANYDESDIAATSYRSALISANAALDSMSADNVGDVEGFSVQFFGSDAYLFEDTDGNGTANQVIVLLGVDSTEIGINNFVV